MTFDDETLGAYVDGELDAAASAVIEATARTDQALAARIAEARKLRGAMSGAFASVVAEAPPERLIKVVASAPKPAQASKPAQAKVIPFRKPAPPPEPSQPAPQWSRPVWGAMAACLAIGVAVGVVAPWESKTDAGLSLSPVIVTALNTQASGPNAGPVRIGLSFKARDGGYCRTFTAGTTAGLACRERSAWTVKAAAPAAAPAAAADGAAYETASSQTPAAVLDLVDTMIDGAPLDAQAEAQARKRRWR